MASRWNDDPVVITVAPTGAEVTREQNPAVPYTPEEIARSTAAAAARGAAVVHLHAREEDGGPSGNPDHFVDIVGRLERSTEMITMVSTGGAVGMSVEERVAGLRASPDLSGVESGSLNFGEDPFITAPATARAIIDRADSSGIGLEVEAFDVAHVLSAVRWLEDGILRPPLRVNLVFGVPGGIDPSPEGLAAMLRPLPPDSFWTVTCVGREHFRMLGLALLWGAPGIRTGLEDVIYLSKGVLADSNAALVGAAAELARSVGRTLASPTEARSLLGLPGRMTAGPSGDDA